MPQPHTPLPGSMMKVQRDPVNDAAHLPEPMPEVQPPREADISSSLYHITPTTDPFLTAAWDDANSSFDKHFPTTPLDDDIWTEEQIPDRCLYIHETTDEPNNQCSYLCPYDSTTFQMDLLQSTPQSETVFHYDLMDLSDISSDLPHIMATMSEADIPDLEDVSDAVWFA